MRNGLMNSVMTCTNTPWSENEVTCEHYGKFEANVDTLMTVLNDCAKNKYKRKIASEAIANSKTGTNVDKTDSSRSKSEPSSKPAKRKPSVCLEFDSNGAPIIQGLVTESLDDTILLENVSCALGCISYLFCRPLWQRFDTWIFYLQHKFSNRCFRYQ